MHAVYVSLVTETQRECTVSGKDGRLGRKRWIAACILHLLTFSCVLLEIPKPTRVTQSPCTAFYVVPSYRILQSRGYCTDTNNKPYAASLFTAPRTSTSTSHVRVCWIRTMWLVWLWPSQLAVGSFAFTTAAEICFAFGSSTNSCNLLC